MTTSETSRFVRLRVELVLEIEGPEPLSAAALGRIVADDGMREDERAHAEATVREDPAEALAYLVEPYDLVRDVPGVELAQASWTSEEIDYDPDAVEWALDEDDEAEGDEDEGEDGDDDEDDDEGGDGPWGVLGDGGADGAPGGRGARFDHRNGQGPR
ncbi:hypothetical protein ACIO1C_30080 [Streptomyces sp. NPDC087420]|uniref:hypothetical protein n=1 Tax=Streptomyces sp. NPDC087420 TaxID=3365785 RepID=UPI003832C04A